MNSEEKEITYTTRNSYSTLNTLTERTKNVWFVFHGMGYLSRYFLRYFKHLNVYLDVFFIKPCERDVGYKGAKLYDVKNDFELKIYIICCKLIATYNIIFDHGKIYLKKKI